LSANTARHPAGICAGIGSNRRQKWFQIQMVMALAIIGQGRNVKYTSNINNLHRWFLKRIWAAHLKTLVKVRGSARRSRSICWYFCWHLRGNR
jgi:hypothetical protein